MKRLAVWLTFVFVCAGRLPTFGDEPAANDFAKADPAAVGIDGAALERLRKRAEQTDSDAVVVVKDGKLVVEWTFSKDEGPIEAMSATKSVVGLAIGRLLDDGRITSLDQPVCEFYPEWRQGRKERITIRQLLNHTSGLQNNVRATEIYQRPTNFIQLALCAELSDDPGTKFSYNNKAVTSWPASSKRRLANAWIVTSVKRSSNRWVLPSSRGPSTTPATHTAWPGCGLLRAILPRWAR
jgi:CubicO group peptidase (beta-lactamase class C family)